MLVRCLTYYFKLKSETAAVEFLNQTPVRVSDVNLLVNIS